MGNSNTNNQNTQGGNLLDFSMGNQNDKTNNLLNALNQLQPNNQGMNMGVNLQMQGNSNNFFNSNMQTQNIQQQQGIFMNNQIDSLFYFTSVITLFFIGFIQNKVQFI